MRLCQVVEAAVGDTGRHVVELTRALATRGHDLTLIYSPTSADSAFRHSLCDIRAEVVPLPIERAASWRDIPAARSLGRMLAKRGPFEVLHAHHAKAGSVARLAGTGGAALVYSPHALEAAGRDRRVAARSLIELGERLLGATRTDAFVAANPAEWDDAGRLGIDVERRHLIANGNQAVTARPRGEARKALGTRDGDCWIGFIGRLTPDTAPLLFVAAALGAMRRQSNVRALILGDGEQAVLVAQAIAASDHAHRFVWLRGIATKKWIAGIDLLVVPGRAGAVDHGVVEAVAVGVPVIATMATGARQLLGEGGGQLCGSEALPALLLALLADPTRLVRLRKEAVSAARAVRDTDMVDRTEALYVRLAARR